MISAANTFRGLTGADIAALFGKSTSPDATSDTQPATRAANPISGTALVGSGSDAAKAIQTIVTQLQVEKMQANVQGKIATLDSVSLATTYDTSARTSDNHTINVSTTKLDLTATATATDLQGAVDTLLSKVKTEQAQVEAAQGGVLMTRDQIVYGGHSSETSVTWTSNSVTLSMKAAENYGVELMDQEGALSGVIDFTSLARTLTSPLATAASSIGPAASVDTHGSALFLAVSTHNSSFNSMADREQQIVSDFRSGALDGQNGQAAKDGSGFSYAWDPGDDDERSYSLAGVMVSNYDPNALASRIALYGKWSVSADENSVTMGGDVLFKNKSTSSFQETLYVIIPLDNRP